MHPTRVMDDGFTMYFQLQFQAHQTITPSRSTSDVSASPTVHTTAANTDAPNKKKRFAKLRIRGGGKASDRPKVLLYWGLLTWAHEDTYIIQTLN